MERRQPHTYVPEVFEVLAQIGKIVGQEVFLYRYYNKQWLRVIANNITTYGTPAYSAPEGYGQFVVAVDGFGKPNKPVQSITAFSITPFTGSCALCISTGASVNTTLRNRGINKLGIRLRIAIAGATGYTGLVCTDITGSIYSIRTIEGAGFKKLYSLNNKRTKNNINLYIKELE